ncbi:MAG: Mov34/MPN/PAD-1 family protein [Achromobacter pulmonis]
MNRGTLVYALPGASWSLVFPPDALEVLRTNAQVGRRSKEAAGQIYARNLSAPLVTIEAVTKLKPRNSWFAGVKIDITAVDSERAAMFSHGLHCLGFWHSHPEPIPKPSHSDRILAANHARASSNEFTALVFIIVGTAVFPDGLGVWVHDGNRLHRADLVPSP